MRGVPRARTVKIDARLLPCGVDPGAQLQLQRWAMGLGLEAEQGATVATTLGRALAVGANWVPPLVFLHQVGDELVVWMKAPEVGFARVRVRWHCGLSARCPAQLLPMGGCAQDCSGSKLHTDLCSHVRTTVGAFHSISVRCRDWGVKDVRFIYEEARRRTARPSLVWSARLHLPVSPAGPSRVLFARPHAGLGPPV